MAVETQAPVGSQITLEEFLNSYDGVRAEWLDGSVIEMSPVNRRHHQVIRFLRRLFDEVVGDGGGDVFVETYALRTSSGSVRLPDIMVLLPESLAKVKDTYVAESADLVVEVASPDSFGRDRGEKFLEYEAAKVREYWIIDPERKTAEFYVLRDARLHAVSTIDGSFTSTVLPQLRIQPQWLWQDPPPPLTPILRKLGL